MRKSNSRLRETINELTVILISTSYPNGDLGMSCVGSQVDKSGNRMMIAVTTRSDIKKIIAPRRTVWIGIFAIPLTA